MNKLLLFFTIIFVSFPILAQNPDIVGSWYLNAYTADLEEPIYLSPFSAPQNPTLTINSDLTFEGIAACNTFSGVYEDTGDEFTYEHIDFSSTDEDCGTFNGFEEDYFDHFDDHYESYSYVYVLNNGMLQVEFAPGFGLQFQSTPFFTEPALPNTWYLTEYHNDLEEDLDIASIEPPISPNLVITENLEFTAEAACNTFSGRFIEDTNGEGFVLQDFQKTTNACTDPEHIQFETDYENALAQSGNLFFNTNGTTNGDEYLRASNQLFGFMNFRNTPLLGASENSVIDFALFPNPVSSELNIVSATEAIDSVVVFGLNGNRVLVSEDNIRSIDVSSLTSGLYFVQISSEGKTSVKKFIKQ